MLQVLGRTEGVVTARMPVPGLGPQDVLVLNCYSLISTGTETAGLRPERTAGASTLAQPALPPFTAWTLAADARLSAAGAHPQLQTPHGPQAAALASPALQLAGSTRHAFIVRVRLLAGNLACGLLAADGATWLARQQFACPGTDLCFRLDYQAPPGEDVTARLVLCNHRPGLTEPSSCRLLEASWLTWALDVPSPVAAAPETSQTAKTRVKRSVARMLAQLTGEAPERHEAALQTWWRWLNGRPNPGKPETAAAAPFTEAAWQGWSMGYASAGEVVAVGRDVRTFAPGDRVACAGSGRANHAEVVAVPVNLVVKLPEGIDYRLGCSATVGAIALQGVRRANLQLGERVVVLGLGLIGQLTVQLARAAGCKVLGFDPLAERVRRARQRGLDDGAADAAEFAALVQRRTAGHGADAVLITAASKSAGPINQAMQLCRRRGRVVLSGDVDIHPQRPAFYQKEIDLLMATSYGPGRYDATYEEQGQDYPLAYARWTANRNLQSYLELLACGRVEFVDLIDGEFPIDQAPAAYDALVQAEPRPLAVLLHYPTAGLETAEVLPALQRQPLHGAPLRPRGPLNFVLVGAGAFAQGMLVQQLLALPEFYQFHGVVSRRVEGVNFARANNVPHVGTDLQPFLDDPDVHLVVLATRHDEHADQVLAALRAGKHVFVEKPLAISWEQLDRLTAGYAQLEDRPHLLVGFNRRFSPALRQLRAALAERRGPLQLNYRVHAGRLPLDHWVQGTQGGGRNLGEACHFYDVFRFLTGAAVTDVQALPLKPCPADLLPTDNFAVLLRYADGSLANLVYTALGPKEGLPKERLEVFCDGTAFVLDDYCRLTLTGAAEPLWEGAQDKGHAAELRCLGESIVRGEPLPLGLEEILETTALALKIEEMLR